jgi:hypothetical protein
MTAMQQAMYDAMGAATRQLWPRRKRGANRTRISKMVREMRRLRYGIANPAIARERRIAA